MKDKALDILFVTDFVCPYCIVAKEALTLAMEETGVKANVRIWPLELTCEPKKRVDTYNDPVRREHYKVLEAPMREMGITGAHIPPHVVPRPYTRLAWEGWHYACAQGKGDAFAHRMYTAYFMDELDIGDVDVLCALAEQTGLDAQGLRTALEEGTFRHTEEEATTYARKVLKVTHVPTIFVNGREASCEEYTVEAMKRMLLEGGESCCCAPDEAAAEEETEEAGGCGPDGCSF